MCVYRLGFVTSFFLFFMESWLTCCPLGNAWELGVIVWDCFLPQPLSLSFSPQAGRATVAPRGGDAGGGGHA